MFGQIEKKNPFEYKEFIIHHCPSSPGIKLSCLGHSPNSRKRHLSNHLKSLSCSLQHGIYLRLNCLFVFLSFRSEFVLSLQTKICIGIKMERSQGIASVRSGFRLHLYHRDTGVSFLFSTSMWMHLVIPFSFWMPNIQVLPFSFHTLQM